MTNNKIHSSNSLANVEKIREDLKPSLDEEQPNQYEITSSTTAFLESR